MSKHGVLTTICGPMFSGKSTALITRAIEDEQKGKKVILFKPSIDDRYSSDFVVTHDKIKKKVVVVKTAYDLLKHVEENTCDVVYIDEVQFLDKGLYEVIGKLLHRGISVTAGGLDMKFDGSPFDITAHLLCVSDYIEKLKGKCSKCGQPSGYSHRLISGNEEVLIGSNDFYEPLCSDCFFSLTK